MTGTVPVIIDACVLANFSLCDTLLRLAEEPRLFEPKWSDEIIQETTRTLESKLHWPSTLVAYLESELRAHLSDAWVSGYESPLCAQNKLHAQTKAYTILLNPRFFAGRDEIVWEHGHNKTVVRIPRRPINNRPQVNNLPHVPATQVRDL
jgi:hypothetical protein